MVLSTFENEESGKRVARELVEQQLVTCVNLLPGATSLYRWEGKVCEENEVVALMKTTSVGYSRLEERLAELHPYDEPEILAIPAAAGSEGYLDFVKRGVK